MTSSQGYVSENNKPALNLDGFKRFMASYDLQKSEFKIDGRTKQYSNDRTQWNEYVQRHFTKISPFPENTEIDYNQFKEYIHKTLRIPATDNEIIDLYKRMVVNGEVTEEKFCDLVNGYPLPLPNEKIKKK